MNEREQQVRPQAETDVAQREWTNPPPRLALVVPCYNEQEVLPETIRLLRRVLDDLAMEGLIQPDSFALYVDDGSRDTTWDLIATAQSQSDAIAGVKLARNAGHQKALLAGLEAAADAADCVVSIDADLQDDVGAIRDMVLKYREGSDVVYGVRRLRREDTWFKRNTALGFYRLMRGMGVNIVDNHADYRLMSRRALAELSRFEEANMFLRGVVPLLGFPSAKVYYDRHARLAGESKYPLKKMLAFAADGITSFSLAPLRFVTFAGAALTIAAVLGGIAAVACLAAGLAVPGWVAIFVSVWFLGGAQLAACGVIGEYVGKTHQEAKHRPRFIVETVLEPRSSGLVQPVAARLPAAAAAPTVSEPAAASGGVVGAVG